MKVVEAPHQQKCRSGVSPIALGGPVHGRNNQATALYYNFLLSDSPEHKSVFMNRDDGHCTVAGSWVPGAKSVHLTNRVRVLISNKYKYDINMNSATPAGEICYFNMFCDNL